MPFELPKLPYAYDALEPYIDARTMEIHYSKHHAGYTKNLTDALDGYQDLQAKSIEDILADLDAVPETIRTAVRNNGGGFANHALFWSVMGPDAGGVPGGALAEAINDKFGDFGTFKDTFSKAGATRFGSGWAWLALKGGGELEVLSTPNQDSPISLGMSPLLALDVWEHAYYLNYQNRRGDYITAWWNVVNWMVVEKNYIEAK